MNEKQATTQQKLSHRRPIGQDSTDDSDTDIEQNTEITNDEKKIKKSTFIIMIGVGLLLDAVGLIPLLGWFTSSLILILIYLKLGVKFHLKNVLKFGACDLIKLIPGLSIIPAFTLSVILNLGPMIEGLEDAIPGGEAVVHSVQKALSDTKK
jgi:predicted nucleic acid-binding Zn ribbon protein